MNIYQSLSIPFGKPPQMLRLNDNNNLFYNKLV